MYVIFPGLAIVFNESAKLIKITNIPFKLIGILSFAIGVPMVLYCVSMLVKIGGGTPVPTDPPKKFVAKGLYKVSRNPIYIGNILIFLGASLILGHLLLYVYTLLAIMFFHMYIVFFEEPDLKERFGESYKEYCKKTPRWLVK